MPVILIVIGLILIIYNYRAIKRENITFEIQDKSSPFNKILDDSKNEMTDYKMELGILRKNMAESLTELQEEILDIKTRLNAIEHSGHENSFNKISENEDEEDLNKNVNIDNINTDIETSIKAEKIKEFLKMGLTEDEICHELSISKGEVLLVKDLFKK